MLSNSRDSIPQVEFPENLRTFIGQSGKFVTSQSNYDDRSPNTISRKAISLTSGILVRATFGERQFYSFSFQNGKLPAKIETKT